MTYRVVGLRELERSFAAMGAATARGEARAVNRVSTSIITAQSRAITGLVNLQVGRVKDAIRVVQKATPDAPRIVLEVQRRPIGLIQFKGSWRGPKSEGATASVWRGGGRSVFGGTFIAKGLSGSGGIGDNVARYSNSQIFERHGPKRRATRGRYIGQMRQPLKAFYGVSVYSMFLRDDIQRVGNDTWAVRLPIELDRETQFALRQAGLI
jgi:hypothetical protein